MKRIILIILALSVAVCASAQSVGLALDLGQSSYYGTARTLGMGNAVTAVGADLGSANINPAGPAIVGYSQFTITPGLVISSSRSEYATCVGKSAGSSSDTRFYVPNVGVVLHFDTGLNRGLRSFTFGFVANHSQNFLNNDSAGGIDNRTSMTGYYAQVANETGMPGDIYADKNRYSTVNSRNYGWNTILSYENKLINYNPAMPDGKRYYGSTQKYVAGELMIPGNLHQQTSSNTTGCTNDLLFNFGFNIDNTLYLGVNLGVPTSRYNYWEFYSEVAENPKNFPVTVQDDKSFWDPTFFQNLSYTYNYSVSTTGIYGKFGALWLPNDFLRIGAAIKTPTAYRVTDNYQSDMTISFEDSKQSVSGNPSPYGEYSYRYTSPFEANIGLAATFGKLALISVDYELTSFGTMRFVDSSNRVGPMQYGSSFYDLNKTISQFCGLSHFVRVGGEININRFVALRAGFNFMTDPKKSYADEHGNKITMDDYLAFFEDYESGLLKLGTKLSNTDHIRAYTLGVGYNSGGSFFADLAARMTCKPNNVFSPYGDYDMDYLSPTATIYNRKLFDITLTLGFRF